MELSFNKPYEVLSANKLKLIALISMTIDHIGLLFFPYTIIFRILGRFAFPIFAYFIAVGCYYTHNKLKHLLHLLLPATVFQIVYSFTPGIFVISIFGTFTVSALLIYLIDYYKVIKNASNNMIKFLYVIMLSVLFILIFALTRFITFDYGFIGIITPVILYFIKNKNLKLLALSGCLILITLSLYETYYFMFLANCFNLISIPVLALYNGKKGNMNLKYLFYIYYPLHLIVLYGLYFILTL